MDTSTTQLTQPAYVPKRLYKSTARSVNIIMPEGQTLHFKFGRFITGDDETILYLDRAIARNEFAGMIYIDPNARTISEEEENPMKALEKQIIARYLADQSKHLDPANDMGESKQGPLNAASTTDIAPVAIGGPGTAALMVAAGLTPGRSAPGAAK